MTGSWFQVLEPGYEKERGPQVLAWKDAILDSAE